MLYKLNSTLQARGAVTQLSACLPGLIAVFFSILACIPAASAGDVIMRGRLLLQVGKYDIHVATPAPGSDLKMGDTIGVVLWDDGTIGEKHFIFAQNNREEEGSLMGFAVYRFPDGDTMTFEFDGKWDNNGLAGQYERLLFGTGRFKDASVVGTWVGASSAWADTMVVDVTLNIEYSK